MVTDVKRKTISKKFMAAALAAAPKAAVFDDENPPTKRAQMTGGIVSYSLDDLRAQLAQRRTRGPGKKPARVAIQLRLPPDVLARWKAGGPGWQTRMAERLARSR
jgi:uncharacterized protein (DUF4415 family)